MTPLGPMNGKSFGTSISPWVITLEALSPFKTTPLARNPAIPTAPYLEDVKANGGYSIKLSAEVQSSALEAPSTICSTDFSSLYWTLRHLVAQQTINGCNVNTGDILATGTISGTTPDSHGCLMEIAASGGVDVTTVDGKVEKKVWLADGDTLTITALAGPNVGFGDCFGKVLPAR
jgi:fumarylacetoacetase